MSENQEKKARRSFKNLIVDRGLQSRLSLNFVAVNFCVSGVGLFLIIEQVGHVRRALENVPGLMLEGHEDLANSLVHLLTTCFGLIIATILINFIFGLYLAHRFAGPMQVITKTIDELIEGRFSERRELRPGDELKPIMEKLSILAAQLNKGAK